MISLKNMPTREQKVATGHTVKQFTRSFGAVLSRASQGGIRTIYFELLIRICPFQRSGQMNSITGDSAVTRTLMKKKRIPFENVPRRCIHL